MIGWSPLQFWRASLAETIWAIEGFKQFHCAGDDKKEATVSRKTTSLYAHY